MISAGASAFIIEQPEPYAAARSRVYALLADAFAYPRGDAAGCLREGRLIGELRVLATALPEPLDMSEHQALNAGGGGHDALPETYSRLFDTGAGRPLVSLLERRHGRGPAPDQELFEDLLRFYSFFGLDFAGTRVQENPDHLLTELEFMHYLSFLEAGARQGREDLRRGQRDFLSLHLAQWTDSLAAALARQSDAQPYTTLAALLRDFVESDRRHFTDSRVGMGGRGTEDHPGHAPSRPALPATGTERPAK